MAVTVTNILAGPATLYHGTFGATEPATADVAPGVGWTDLGGTDGGARLVVSQTYTPLTVDQVAMAVGTRKTEQSVSIATSLAEPTLENLGIALNATPAADSLELDAEIGNEEPDYSAILLVGQKPGGGPRIVVIRRALSTESVEMAWTKDGKTMIPVTFTGYYVSPSVSAIKIDDSEAP